MAYFDNNVCLSEKYLTDFHGLKAQISLMLSVKIRACNLCDL
jgi:hypothetical protein